ncbi:MAG: hypothetical protein HRT71_05605 [Flavobacteriales bacterium]|nr:hypothetical protein [Flavobacteriales bacterium]
MVYLTWGIGFNGIYLSQVLGVVKHLSSLSKTSILVVSFVPYTTYTETRKRIKAAYSNSLVLPMIPSRNHWWPLFALMLAPLLMFSGRKGIMTRGVLANQIGLLLRKLKIVSSVVYDGRGAEMAEWKEYNLVQSVKLLGKIEGWESNSVINSDFRLGVSEKLLEYWRAEFGYQGQKLNHHIVVPCTINSSTNNGIEDNSTREKYGYSVDDVIIVYSGSQIGWQSFHLIDDLLLEVLQQSEKVKVLFMAQIELDTLHAYVQFPDKFVKMWVNPEEVVDIISMCDYGLMIREETVTNKVASPTKFAEYLGAGLKVIISPNVGDFSKVVKENDLGIVIDSVHTIKALEQVKAEESARIKAFAKSNYIKSAFDVEYNALLTKFNAN